MRNVQQLFDLAGKTALVTGGSRGLGLQIAEALGEQGAKIVLSSRKQSDLDEAVAHLKARGINASAIAADLSQEAAVAPLVAETLKRLGHVDILINNAGATWGAPAEDDSARETATIPRTIGVERWKRRALAVPWRPPSTCPWP